MPSAGRGRYRLLSAFGLLAALAAATLVLVLNRSSGPSSDRFGANVNLLFNGRSYPPAEIDAQLAALASTGATLARSDAFWEATEPAAPTAGVHHYDWSFDDTVATALAAHHLRWLPIIDYTAPWDRSIPGRDHSPPASADDYAAYAAAVAARYGPGGSFWGTHRGPPIEAIEVWNEPDNPAFWAPAPDPARYAALYGATRAAVRAVAPEVLVLIGGLTLPARFLPAMLHADPSLRGAVDGVAIHPYGSSTAAVLGNVARARQTLVALGLGGVPLYVTEVGWTTSPPGVSDYAPAARRPGLISSTMAALGCGVAQSFIYTWISPERNPADKEDWFGISSAAHTPTPSVAAFADGIRAAPVC